MSSPALPLFPSWPPRRGKTPRHRRALSQGVPPTVTGHRLYKSHIKMWGVGEKNGGNDVYPCCSLRNSRLSESSETESDVSKVNSRSEELLPTPVSSTSTDSSFGEGRRRRRCTFSDCFLLPFTRISCPRASKRQSVSCTRSFCNQRSSENCQIIGAKEKKMQTSCCECITASP